MNFEGFLSDSRSLVRHPLGDNHQLITTALPNELLPNEILFQQFWEMHPVSYPEIWMHGRRVKTPRWQQAYGKDYFYSGQMSNALAVPKALRSIADWIKATIDDRLNGLLLNWYDGSLGHYIGKHRDSTKGLVQDTPIVTISLGETRTFRMRPFPGSSKIDVEATHGTVIIMPWETNLAWTHEVPKSRRTKGKRISITARAFHTLGT